jgi:hypothetical protein
MASMINSQLISIKIMLTVILIIANKINKNNILSFTIKWVLDNAIEFALCSFAEQMI